MASPWADDLRSDAPSRPPKSSVLKSFMQRSNHSNALSPSKAAAGMSISTQHHDDDVFMAAADHRGRALEELSANDRSVSPKKSRELSRSNVTASTGKTLHKKAFSAYSLKSLASRDDDKPAKVKTERPPKPKKTKSATNLASLLSRPKSSRSPQKITVDVEAARAKDKENTTPPTTSPDLFLEQTPIYAQFSTQNLANSPRGGKFFEHDDDLLPERPSPTKQRSYFNLPRTNTLPEQEVEKEAAAKPRPISEYLPAGNGGNIAANHPSRGRHEDELRSFQFPQKPSERMNSPERAPASPDKKLPTPTAPEMTLSKRGSRVMAAVAKFSSKEKENKPAPPQKQTEPKKGFGVGSSPDMSEVSLSSLVGQQLEGELESMLDYMNIPQDQRQGMRELDVVVKRDLIRHHRSKLADAQSHIRPESRHDSANGDVMDDGEIEKKMKRPRSRTFTLSRASKEKTKDKEASFTKKRSDGTLGRHMRTKSSESVASMKSNASVSSVSSVASSLIAKAKGQQLPEDFVSYLKKVQKPEQVEVGKLHKLRLLLRNETVAWTDAFVDMGGMREIVALLHRITDVEWREEHEDLLLHETLLCLKALCTTAMALQYLNEIHSTLFPVIIHMLFDPEKKGPSDFTTRSIITWVLFTYLKSAPLSERAHRARTLLSYLRDPQPQEAEKPLPFVMEMRRDRPYRVWCTEVVNVSKEVFWIFLHNLNVIALSDPSTQAYSTTTSPSSSPVPAEFTYMATHFPVEQPPVPAAPYVGGVEWDATHYLASHLDIVNGILASLPTAEERNAVRVQLRISGWEKCMGGSLRTCKEKFYACVHASLRCWAAAAYADGWDTEYVRCGTQAGKPLPPASPRKPASPTKKAEAPPKLDLLSLGNGAGAPPISSGFNDSWL